MKNLLPAGRIVSLCTDESRKSRIAVARHSCVGLYASERNDETLYYFVYFTKENLLQNTNY